MRDIVLGLLVLYFTFQGFRVPWVGIMAWTVISIMNPHRYSWWLDAYPVAAMIAGSTLVGMIISRDRKSFPVSRETVMLILLMLWITVTWLMSPSISANYEGWKKVMKIDFMILVALYVLYSRLHIMALAWMLAISIGFYGFKGGIFTLMTGGSYRVWGPQSSYIGGNNELALALIVIIPILRFLQVSTENVWVKRLLMATMLLSAVAALGSHSRGALLAIAAMGLVMWWRSDNKIVSGVVIGVVGAAAVTFMPDHWVDRMQTIETYEEDASAMGRINAWVMAWNLARDRFFGGSFDIYNFTYFSRYAPIPEDIHAAHSIYFQILGEHGFVGLFIYLLMWLFVWLSAGHLRKHGRARPETKWLSDLGSMIQVSLAGFAVGGTFLSLAYFDMPYNLLVLVVLGRAWMARQAWTEEPEHPIPLTNWFNRLMSSALGLSRRTPT